MRLEHYMYGGIPPSSRWPGRRERGVALIAVLWVLTLLAVIAASVTKTARTEMLLARNLEHSAQAEALADAGIWRAILPMLDPHIDRRWRADGTAYSLLLGEGLVRISIQDEGGKIDLNKGKDEHLERLFRLAGLAEREAVALVDAIVDYRDENDLAGLNGAEEADYRAAGLPHGPKNAPFEVVAELNLVLGMTPALYSQVAPFLTVYSGREKIDLVTAPAEVLLAVPGIFAADVEELLAARARMDGPLPTEPLPLPMTADARAFAMANQRIYTIRAEALTERGAIFVREAVVELTTDADQPFRFLSWRRGIGTQLTEFNEAD